MKIVFFGFDGSFDYYQIGGMDSIMRRLALSMREAGDEVSFVHYGAKEDKTVKINENFYLRYFRNIRTACEYLVESDAEHIVSVYISPKDRYFYARFRTLREEKSRFHHIYSVWSESPLKRKLLFSEAKIFPYNGSLFCLSPRIYRYVSKWAHNAELIFPPVPDSYFCDIADKSIAETLHITYVGRIDPRKGAPDAAKLFKKLSKIRGIETGIYGYAWEHSSAALRLQEDLLSDGDINYEQADYRDWSLEEESKLIKVLKNTDVLLLPYRRLSSSVDTPLLLLEGMAGLCSIITPALGDLHDTYGSSYFNMPGGWSSKEAIMRIKSAKEHVQQDRKRLVDQNAHLKFSTENVTRKFRECLVGRS
ncbi:MAG: glycosyltransferase [Candidatus Omnitrophica bacterium]|nr:glycosyltransferase [Candidatus Omnitrophota bacterium]